MDGLIMDEQMTLRKMFFKFFFSARGLWRIEVRGRGKNY